MRIFNPCKKCLIQPACTTECQEHYEHTVFKENLLYIPKEINRYMKKVYKEIKFIYQDEPTFIKLWLSVLFVAEGFAICLIMILMYVFIKIMVNSV